MALATGSMIASLALSVGKSILGTSAARKQARAQALANRKATLRNALDTRFTAGSLGGRYSAVSPVTSASTARSGLMAAGSSKLSASRGLSTGKYGAAKVKSPSSSSEFI